MSNPQNDSAIPEQSTANERPVEATIDELKCHLEQRIDKLSYQLEESVKRQAQAAEWTKDQTSQRHADLTAAIGDVLKTVQDVCAKVGDGKSRGCRRSASRKGHAIKLHRPKIVRAKGNLEGVSASTPITNQVDVDAAHMQSITPYIYSERNGKSLERVEGPPVDLIDFQFD